MLFTVPQDALCAFALGEVIAMSAARGAPTASRLWERPFQEALLYFGAVFVPVCYSFYHLWPDWCLLYLVDAVYAPKTVPLLAFLSIFTAGALGYVVGHGLMARKARVTAIATLVLAIGGVGAWLVVFPERLMQVGTYEEFMAGAARSYFDEPMLLQAGVGALFCALGLFFVLRSHRRAARERASENDGGDPPPGRSRP